MPFFCSNLIRPQILAPEMNGYVCRFIIFSAERCWSSFFFHIISSVSYAIFDFYRDLIPKTAVFGREKRGEKEFRVFLDYPVLESKKPEQAILDPLTGGKIKTASCCGGGCAKDK
jgi:hypothetical protein